MTRNDRITPANRRPAGQSDGSGNFQREHSSRCASPAAVAWTLNSKSHAASAWMLDAKNLDDDKSRGRSWQPNGPGCIVVFLERDWTRPRRRAGRKAERRADSGRRLGLDGFALF